MRTEHEAVTRIIAAAHPRRALDVGTGSGRYLPILASIDASMVVGIDFSLAMLSGVPGAWPRVCADARALPLADATFDLINASLIAGDMMDMTGWIGGMARVLAPCGQLVYSDFHPTWAEHGWRRTFQTVDGRTVDVPYISHAITDHVTAIRGAGLECLSLREIRLSPDGAAETQRFLRQWGDPPVLLVVHAVKRGAQGHDAA